MAALILLIQNYGYILVFFFTVLEGETIVALAGFVAYQGYLNIYIVVFVAICGAITGDQGYFYLGRYKGKQFLASRPKLLSRVTRIHGLIERHQNWLMFGSRFMYGFRIALPIAFGTSNIKRLKYLGFNFMGATLWSVFFAVGGYFLGDAIERFIVHVQRAEKFIVFGVIVGIVLVQTIMFLRRRIASRLEEEEERAEKARSDASNTPIA